MDSSWACPHVGQVMTDSRIGFAVMGRTPTNEVSRPRLRRDAEPNQEREPLGCARKAVQVASAQRKGQTTGGPSGLEVPQFQHSENWDSRISWHFGQVQEGPASSGRGSPDEKSRISSKAASACSEFKIHTSGEVPGMTSDPGTVFRSTSPTTCAWMPFDRRRSSTRCASA